VLPPPPQEYCEDCPDEKKVVRRDPAMADNSLLPAAFFQRTGDLVYSGLKDGFEVGGRMGGLTWVFGG
jgi:hypothetical protein